MRKEKYNEPSAGRLISNNTADGQANDCYLQTREELPIGSRKLQSFEFDHKARCWPNISYIYAHPLNTAFSRFTNGRFRTRSYLVSLEDVDSRHPEIYLTDSFESATMLNAKCPFRPGSAGTASTGWNQAKQLP